MSNINKISSANQYGRLMDLPNDIWSHCLSFLTAPMQPFGEVARVELGEDDYRGETNCGSEMMDCLNWGEVDNVALTSKFFSTAVFRWRYEYNSLYVRGQQWKRWSVAEDMFKRMFPDMVRAHEESPRWCREIKLVGKYLSLTHSYRRLEEWRSGGEVPRAHVERITAFLDNDEANFHRLGICNVKMRNSIAEITNALRGNHTVSEVYFYHDNITNREAVMLADVLTSNDAVEHLDLSNPNAAKRWFVEASPEDQEGVRNRQFNKIGDVAARALVEAVLPKAKFTLDLRGNPISRETAVALSALMSSHGKTLLI